eukprot:530326_1
MINLILYSLEEGIKERSDADKTNVLRPETMEMFTNVKKVVIDTWNNYCISLVALLSLVSKTEWEQVIVKARGKKNWISVLFSNEEKRMGIVKQYKQKNYNIKMNDVGKRE